MNYKEIEEIKKEFYLNGCLQKEAEFECYADDIATYHLYEESGSFHEIQIINRNVIFFKKEKVIDLLEGKNPFYISHRVFAKLDDLSKEPFEQVGKTKTFRIVDHNK